MRARNLNIHSLDPHQCGCGHPLSTIAPSDLCVKVGRSRLESSSRNDDCFSLICPPRQCHTYPKYSDAEAQGEWFMI